MTLTTDQMDKVVTEMVLGMPPSIYTAEADLLRYDIMAEVRAGNYTLSQIDVGHEIPNVGQLGMKIRLKGGPGSGFTSEAGHQGIIGQVGGSQSRELNISDSNIAKLVKSVSTDGAYWVLPGKQVVKIRRMTTEHWEVAYDILLSNAIQGNSYDDDANVALLHLGAIRVITSNPLYTLETENLDDATLKHIQKLVDDGIFPYKSGQEIYWSGGLAQTGATMSDFMQAKHVVYSGNYNNWELKQQEQIVELKGGEGSGFHGHAGRPGKKGGSAHDNTNPVSKKNMVEFVNFVTSTQENSIYGVVKRHGKFYNPQPLPKGYKKEHAKECYSNAWHLAERTGLQYVEGLAMPDFMDIPIEHAWCVDDKGNVYDNTWPKPGRVYYGVPFDDNFVRQVLVETGTFGVIKFESEVFRKRYAVGDMRKR